MQYFYGITTLEGLKKAYRKLALRWHPDRKGGCTETMKKINLEYETIFEELRRGAASDSQRQSFDDAVDYRDIVNACIRLGLSVEVCGTWVWVDGDTKPHREMLKSFGLRWAAKKKRWYLKPKGYKKRSQKEWSMSEIRSTFGSERLTEEI